MCFLPIHRHSRLESNRVQYGSQFCSWSAINSCTESRMIFSMPPFAPENVVSRDRFGCLVPRQTVRSPRSASLILVLTRWILSSPSLSATMPHLLYAIIDGVSPDLVGSTEFCVPDGAPRVRRHSASSPIEHTLGSHPGPCGLFSPCLKSLSVSCPLREYYAALPVAFYCLYTPC